MKNPIVILGMAIGISACMNSGNPVELPFPDLISFDQEIKRLAAINPAVIKILVAEGKTETHEMSNLRWDEEFALFKDSDINTPAAQSRYSVKKDLVNQTSVATYIANDTNQPVRQVKTWSTHGKLDSITIHRVQENGFITSNIEMSYAPGKYYRIRNSESGLPGVSGDFQVEGRFIHSISNTWRVTMNLGTVELPFSLLFDENDPGFATILNADEKIEISGIARTEDSLRIRIPVYDSELVFSQPNNGKMSGYWINYTKGNDYRIPVEAIAGEQGRFNAISKPATDFTGRWAVEFSPGTEDAYPAIGVFSQSDNRITGTFLTETGDYRFLEGNVSGDSLFLSCFDGSHAFLFSATNKDGMLSGKFWSGKHWSEPWTGRRDANAKLKPADSLTFLKPGYKTIDFSFPDLEGNKVSLKDKRFSNKVVIIQLFGSWCPNCADETDYLTGLSKKYKADGMEVIALAFEATSDPLVAKERIERHRKHYGADYPFLLAGTNKKDEAAKALPMLNHVMSFPTTIILGRDGDVKKIYTGFSGPGTGVEYTRFKAEFDSLIDQLLRIG